MPRRPLKVPADTEPQRRSILHGTALFGALCGLILAAVVVVPLLRLLIAGASSLEIFSTLMDARTLVSLANTLLMGGAVALLAALLAVPTAWICARTDMPFARQFRAAMLAMSAVPPLAVAIGYLYLASRGGMFHLHSRLGVLAILALATQFPIFSATTSALAEISAEMDEAAHHLGAHPLTLVQRLTLPHIAPVVSAAMINVFLRAIAMFSVPALLILPADVPVVSTEVWLAFGRHAPVATLAALALPLLAVSALMLWLQRWVLRRRRGLPRSAVDAPAIVPLGRGRWPAFLYVVALWALAVGVPVAGLIVAALTPTPAIAANANAITFDLLHAAINTILYAIAAASIALLFATVIAYGVRRHLVSFGHWLSLLCLATLAAPGIVLATAFYAAYASDTSMLNGTVAVVILAFTARLLPQAYRMASTAIEALSAELEEAARMHGAGWWTTLRLVVLPELEWPMLGAWIALFVIACEELSAAVLLFGPATQTLSISAFQMAAAGRFNEAASLACTLLLITMLTVQFATRLLGRDALMRQP